MTCYVLDTDHLSLYERRHPQVRERIRRTRQHSDDTLTITVVSVEEQYAGRLAQIRKANTSEALVAAYQRLQQTYDLFSDISVLEYDLIADQTFREFRAAGSRIGTQGLRIAALSFAAPKATF